MLQKSIDPLDRDPDLSHLVDYVTRLSQRHRAFGATVCSEEDAAAADDLEVQFGLVEGTPIERAAQVLNTEQTGLLNCDERSQYWRTLQLLEEVDRHLADTPLRVRAVNGGVLLMGSRWWERNSRASRSGSRNEHTGEPLGHLGELQSIRFVDTKDHAVTSLVGTPGYHLVSGNSNCERLSVALCTLSGYARTEFSATRQVRPGKSKAMGFRAEKINWHGPSDDSYLNELSLAVEWAVGEKAQILVFPELCICEKGRQALEKAATRLKPQVLLIVAGSFHESIESEEGVVNRSRTLLYTPENGMVECAHFDKHRPFACGLEKLGGDESVANLVNAARLKSCQSVQEDLKSNNMRFSVVNTEIGTIGVLICLDNLVGESSEKFTEVVDHMIVISMNDSSSARFWEHASISSQRGLTATFYVNAAQTISKGKSTPDLAFWYLPLKYEGENGRVRVRTTDSSFEGAKWQVWPESGRIISQISIPREVQDSLRSV